MFNPLLLFLSTFISTTVKTKNKTTKHPFEIRADVKFRNEILKIHSISKIRLCLKKLTKYYVLAKVITKYDFQCICLSVLVIKI